MYMYPFLVNYTTQQINHKVYPGDKGLKGHDVVTSLLLIVAHRDQSLVHEDGLGPPGYSYS